MVVSRIASEHFSGDFPFDLHQGYGSYTYEMMGEQLAGEGALLFFVGNRIEPIRYSFVYDGKIGGRDGFRVSDVFLAYENQNFEGLEGDSRGSQLQIDYSRAEEIGYLRVPEKAVEHLSQILGSLDIDYQTAGPDSEGRMEVLFYAQEDLVDQVINEFASGAPLP